MKHNFTEEESMTTTLKSKWERPLFEPMSGAFPLRKLGVVHHNKILENLGYKYWYSGNRREFIARHKKALAVLRGFLGETEGKP
jgi:hypothetical protein